MTVCSLLCWFLFRMLYLAAEIPTSPHYLREAIGVFRLIFPKIDISRSAVDISYVN